MDDPTFPKWLENLDSDIYLKDDYVVLDFETTGKDYGDAHNPDNQLVLSCWTVVKGSKRTKKHVRGTEYDVSELVEDIENAEFFVAHNAMFETKWLERCGLDLKNTLSYCTQVGEYVISGNRQWGLSLQACSRRRGRGGKDDLVSMLIKGGVDCEDIHPEWLLKYCEIDVDECEAVFLHQRDWLKRNGMLPVTFARNLKTPVLCDLEKVGMTLDADRVYKEYTELLNKKVELEAEFNDLTGGVNVKSTVQMRQYLYEELKFSPPKDYKGDTITTPKGELATSTAAMQALKPRSKKQKRFIELRNELTKVSDALSKYINRMQACCEEVGGHLQGKYNPTVTQTHRLSSSGKHYGMQLQNIPRLYKRLFCARYPGWLVGEWDYGQLEFRAAVDMADDEQGKMDIANDEDVHAFTASIIFDDVWDPDNPDKEVRTAAKAFSFKPLYGGNSGTNKQKAYFAAFREKYSGITDWQEDNKAQVLRDGYLRIPSGLVFYWPDTKVQSSGYVTNTTSICNYPVQSFATADVVPLALVFFWHRLKRTELKSILISTVHDSVIGEIHPDEKDEMNEIAKKSMIDDVIRALKILFNYEWSTPLGVDGELYPNWADPSSQEKICANVQ